MEISFYSKWVESGSIFKDGAAYYQQHGTSQTLKLLFAKGPNSYTKKRLDLELQQIANTVITEKTTKVDRDQLPAKLQKEFDLQGDRIRKISYLHAQLTLIDDQEERRLVAKKILRLAASRRASFQQIDHYQQTGADLVQKTMPPAPAPVPEKNELERLRLEKEQRLLRTQRSKLKSNKKRIHDYNVTIDRLAEIDKQLKALQNAG